MRLPQNRHLTFCTNIYAGEDWKTTFSELQKYVPDIKKNWPQKNGSALVCACRIPQVKNLVWAKLLPVLKNGLTKTRSMSLQ